MASVCHFIGDNDMMFGVDRSLDIVTNNAAMIASGCHCAGIRIGDRYLPVGRGLQLLAYLHKFSKTPGQRRQSLGQVINPRVAGPVSALSAS